MVFFKSRVAFLVAGTLVALAACGGNNSALPSMQPAVNNAEPQLVNEDNGGSMPLDNTSILNKLKKDVVIGSTVDPGNGDKGPYSVSIVQNNFQLQQGQLVVCNFENKGGTAGKGTTIELLNPQPSSTPATFAHGNAITGCAGVATSDANSVYGAAMTSGRVAAYGADGKLAKTYRRALAVPFSDADVRCTAAVSKCLYAGEYIFVSDAHTSGIVSFSVNYIGHPNPIEVVKGFAVNGKSGWSALGPSGLSYYYPADTLYVADGVDNTIVGITHTSNLFVKDQVIVKPGGKTFTCKTKGKTAPCGKLVKAGSPLARPVAMTALPNGNLVVANAKGGSELVELTPAGKVLAKKAISRKAVVFGLASTGTTDKNTVIFYTDRSDSTLHELEP